MNIGEKLSIYYSEEWRGDRERGARKKVRGRLVPSSGSFMNTVREMRITATAHLTAVFSLRRNFGSLKRWLLAMVCCRGGVVKTNAYKSVKEWKRVRVSQFIAPRLCVCAQRRSCAAFACLRRSRAHSQSLATDVKSNTCQESQMDLFHHILDFCPL